LFLLVSLHLVINYLGVRGLVMRSLNRQRLGIAWAAYRSSGGTKVPSPTEVSSIERIFSYPGSFRNADSGRFMGHCTIGSSFPEVFRGFIPTGLFDLFGKERYLLWYDHQCLHPSGSRPGQSIRGPIRLHIVLKDGYTTNDQLKAWTHAAELCEIASHEPRDIKGIDSSDFDDDEALTLLRVTYQQTIRSFPDFIERMRATGWSTADVALLSGSPKGVLTEVKGDTVHGEGKKTR